MTDARIAFHQLRSGAGASYDAKAMHADLDVVERRVERVRTVRAVVTGAVVVLAGCAAAFIPRALSDGLLTPAETASASPSPIVSSSQQAEISELALPCTSPTLVAGNAVGDLGGMEGWFNGTSSSSMCESTDDWTEWEQLAAAHPATVLINTIDATMIEAYSRIGLDALGVYATLGGTFEVPHPDPSWPAHSAVLIDARTGEVLSVSNFEEMDNFDPETGEFDYSQLP